MVDDDDTREGGRPIQFRDAPWKQPGISLSDHHLAFWFSVSGGVCFRYLVLRKKWQHFDGVRWSDDNTKRIEVAVGNFLGEEIVPVAKKLRDKTLIGSTAKLLAVVRRLQSMLAIDESVFDADVAAEPPIRHSRLRRIKAGLHKHNRLHYISKAAERRASEGDILKWIDEACLLDRVAASADLCAQGHGSDQQRRDRFVSKIGLLNASWQQWAKRNHIAPGRINDLSLQLFRMRFDDERNRYPQWRLVRARKNRRSAPGRVFCGIKLKDGNDRDDGPPSDRETLSGSPEVQAAKAWHFSCTIIGAELQNKMNMRNAGAAAASLPDVRCYQWLGTFCTSAPRDADPICCST